MRIEDDKWNFVASTLTAMQEQSDRLQNATQGLMIAPESPLLDVQARTEDYLINALALLIDDDMDFISWFVYDCDYGREPKQAGTSKDNMVLIDSLEKLRWLIELTAE